MAACGITRLTPSLIILTQVVLPRPLPTISAGMVNVPKDYDAATIIFREFKMKDWKLYDVSILVKATMTEVFANSRLHALEKLFTELSENQSFTIELMSKEQLKYDIKINEAATATYKTKQVAQICGEPISAICDVDDLRIGRINEEIEGEEK